MVNVLMPKLGMAMTEGTVTEWCVSVNDQVKKGDLLVKIESDKATRDVIAECDGVIINILVDEDGTVPVGTVIAMIKE